MTLKTADINNMYIHGAKGLKAVAMQSPFDESLAWLNLNTDKGENFAVIFLPYPIAEAYASAINTCNDREVADARENTNADA